MFDSHAHYDDKKFNEDRDELLQKLNNEGVRYILNAGVNEQSSKKCVELSEKYDFIYGAVGVHPHDASEVSDNYLKILKELSKGDKVVAIGEIGLDYHYDFSPRDVQKQRFVEQIKLAKEIRLPIIIHDREAHADTLDILKENNINEIGGVMHCFSGSYEMAKEIINLGLYIGIGGPVTFKNAKKTVEVVEKIPLEYILSETDCPYLTPVPYRGKRNHSGYMKHTIEKISHIKNMGFDTVNNKLIQNAKQLFKIK